LFGHTSIGKLFGQKEEPQNFAKQKAPPINISGAE
jgi:hypothetical protein